MCPPHLAPNIPVPRSESETDPWIQLGTRPQARLPGADSSGMHTLNERIDLRSLALGCRQVEALITAVAGPVRTFI